MEEIHAFVHGKVQMVMFRDFVQKKARALALSGWVRNTPERSVEVVARGTEESLKKLIEHLHKGPFNARVLKVDVKWREPTSDERGFEIEY